MIKKIFALLLFVALLVLGYGFIKFKTGKTKFADSSKLMFIRSDEATQKAILESIKSDSICSDLDGFKWMANRLGYWNKIKPGRYKIEAGTSIYGLVKLLKSGIQSPVDFVISRKLRQPQDLARLVGNNFECDSTEAMEFLTNKDSLKVLGLDSTSWLGAIIHNTYSIPWNYSPGKIFRKLHADEEKFWTVNGRAEKAKALGFTTAQVYTLASIVASETNLDSDKPLVASSYLNRLKKGMKLEADPTLIFATKEFGIKRVLNSYKLVNSPYNTYMHTGLPPGPICTVSENTIDAVLNAPKTDYLFFVAEPGLTGKSSFAANYADHAKNAKAYQDWLTGYLLKKKEQEKAKQDSIAKTAKTK